MPTVRITTEVNDALKGMAGRDDETRSVTQIVDDTLRQLTGLDTPAPEATKARARPATLTRPRARRPQPEQVTTSGAKAGPCLHPVGRRIGGVCMECGGKP